METTYEFEGTVVRNVYSADNFKIYALDVDKDKFPKIKRNLYRNVSISGDIPKLTEGVTYSVVGVPKESKYGWGYDVKHIKAQTLEGKFDAKIFLSEILTENQFEEIWEHYPNICDLIKENRLNEIDLGKLYGIGKVTLIKIVKKVNENIHLADLVSEFGGYLTFSTIKKLYDNFTSIDVLKERLAKDPYKCLCSISGIGFKKADTILLEMDKLSRENIENGKEPIIKFEHELLTSFERCHACVVHLLQENENQGHTKMSVVQLRDECIKLTPKCSDWFNDVVSGDDIYYNECTVFAALKWTFNKEKYIAETIVDNISLNEKEVWNYDIEQYRQLDDIDLSDEQMGVLDKLCKYKVSILNGPSGCGKSSSVQAVIKMLDGNKKQYVMFSPTAKAAKVLNKYTAKSASTIHRGLGYNPKMGWMYNKKNKLITDVVILDEFSMVDVWLFTKLIDAIDFTKTRLLLIGDSYQLPSIGCGNLLHDFLESGVIPTTVLTKIFRYSEGGLMKVATDTRNSKKYLTPDMKHKATIFGENKDYVFLDVPDQKVSDNVVKIYKKILSQGCDVKDVQVLTAMNVGGLGTVALNKELQKIANPDCRDKKCIKSGETYFHEGDLVIQKVNNYKAKQIKTVDGDRVEQETLIANGESGMIMVIDKGCAIIDFDGVIIKYQKEDFLNVKLGYAISVHSSQGSEFQNVIAITPKAHSFFSNSNLLYVALTRTKKRCYHVGSMYSVNSAIKKKENLKRNTFMLELLASIKGGGNES